MPLDFPGQIPTSPISSALQWSLFSFFSFYIIFLLCLPLCLSVVSPRGGVCNCWPSSPFWAVKLWGRAVPSASPVRHNWCHRFPKSNRQISTSPISSAFSGRYMSLFFPCHTHVPFDFPSQIVKPPQVLSHLLCSGRYSAFSQFTSFSCCVSRCAFPLCLPGEAFATADRPARSEQWSFGGEQFQAPPRWDTTGAIDFPSQIVKSPQIVSHLLLVVTIFPLPHPCAIRFPKSNRPTPTSPISSALQWSLFSFFSVYIIFLLCLPLCLSVLPPRGGVCNCWPSCSPFWAVKLWGRAVPSASPVRHNWCHRFPKSNRQISTNPISSAFSGRYFFPGRAHVPLDFPGKIPRSPNSSAFSGRYFSLAAPTCH